MREQYLSIFEKPSSTVAEINEDRLKFFNTKVKNWEYGDISQGDYQNILLEDRFSLLKCYCSVICVCECNWTRTHNHLVPKRTLTHLAKLSTYVHDVSSKDFLDTQATIECRFTLKRVREMKRTYSLDNYSRHSSIILPVWVNG